MSPGARADRLGQALGVGCSFAARGLHSVLLPWLLVSASGATGAEIGQVQGAALAAQAGALLLLGGVGARLGARRLAVAAQLAAALPPGVLAFADPSPSLGSLLAYALSSAVLWGVLSPARDSLAARGREGNLLRPTSGFTAAQFTGLLAGIGLGAAAEGAGAPALLAGQALLQAVAAAALAAGRGPHLRAARPRPKTGEPAPRRIALELVLLTALFGATSAGPFAVWAPLLAAERSDAPARTLGLLLALFPVGTIAASLTLRSAGAALSKRRALLVAHAAASLSIAGAGFSPALPLCVACVALWGVCGGVFINCGRALLLELRAPEQHGRTLAQLQLALLLASPVGALLGGATASALGVRGSMELLGVLGCAAALAVAAAGRLRRAAPRFAAATGSS